MIKTLNFIARFAVLGLAGAFVVVFFRPDLLPALDNPAQAAAVDSYADAVNLAAPSVVSIYTRTLITQPLSSAFSDPLFRRLTQDRTITRPSRGLGSGVIVSSDGLILTTLHVIEGVDNIVVALWDGRIAEASVVGADPATDLAVLRISLTDLPAAQLKPGRAPRTGDVVLAIGNAFGLSHTVTMGIISATGRGQLNLTSLEDFIQTDAAINAGNSGGALINPRGEVVGINSASLGQTVGAQGISFAIPAPLARQTMEQIVEYGQVRRGWMGIDLADLPFALEHEGQRITGARISRVDPAGPAWRAGLRSGDVITQADDQSVSSARQLMLRIAQAPPGESMELVVMRGGQLYTTAVTLLQQPPLPEP